MSLGVKLGAHLATPNEPDWATLLDRFQRGRFEAAKVMIPPGFETEPRHVRDLINSGARQVILRTEDNDYTPDRVRHELINRGFIHVIEDHPQVEFIIEVGNEQDLAGMDPWLGRFWQLAVRKELSFLDRPNLKWVASMPTALSQVKVYLERTTESWTENRKINLTDSYDGIGVHMYGHFHVDDGGSGDWVKIFDYLKATTTLPLYITEFGINHPPMEKRDKGKRYLKWLEGLDPQRVPSAYVYWLGDGPRDPQYQVDDAMADVFAKRNGGEAISPPVMTLKEAVEHIQYWAERLDARYQRVRIRDG